MKNHKRMHTRIASLLTALLLLLPTVLTASAADTYDGYAAQKDLAVQAILDRLEEGRDGVYVYRDFSQQSNRFTQRACMSGAGAQVRSMDENWQINPWSGSSCIRCELNTGAWGWGGWLFLSGVLKDSDIGPELNRGEEPGQGLDLTGAKTLEFYARGEKDGEVVEFFTCGFGYDGAWGTRTVPYPDSAKKQSLGYVTLSKDWKKYSISLAGADLSCIACGFGFVCSGASAAGKNQVFFLDEIRFTGSPACAQNAPALLRSYDTDSIYLKNTSFSYDNALAAMALISDGKQAEAKTLLDAFVYAVDRDRFQPGRVRNAYAVGDLRPVPGWEAGAALPGWYDKDADAWYEDRYQVGCNTGNTSYVALALLQYDAAYGSETYVRTAARLMDWVLENCTDSGWGFTAGYEGWPEGESPLVYDLTYKSVEHNIDAYAAFTRLYQVLGEKKYAKAADSALKFLRSMYDHKLDIFYTGTGEDGTTPDKGNIVLDTQVWSAMALGKSFRPYTACLDQVQEMSIGGAYPFCKENKNGGWWAEGTAFTALMYRDRGNDTAAHAALEQLCAIQRTDGLFPAATTDHLSTGIYLFTGEPWEYGTDPHIAPTAWFVMAVNGLNPYSFS